MATQIELDNIKNKLFNRAVSALKRRYSFSYGDSILSRYCSFTVDEVKKERQWFLDNSVLNSRKDEEKDAVQNQFEEQLLAKVLMTIQKEHLIDLHKESMAAYHIVRRYQGLDKRITQEYRKVLSITRHNEFDHCRGAGVIIAPTGSQCSEKDTVDLSAGQRQFLVTSTKGDADAVLVLDNPNPLVWLIIQLGDIGLMVDKYYFYFEVVQTAKQYISENPNANDKHQALLLTCLNKAQEIHSKQASYLKRSVRRFQETCKKHNVDVIVSGYLQGLEQRFIGDLSKFNIKIMKYEPHSKFQEIIMTHGAAPAIPLMEHYLKLCGIPYTRPAGPSIQIADKEARKIKLLLRQYKGVDYSFTLFGQYFLEHEFNRVDWLHLSRKIISMHNAGENNVGWRLIVQLSDVNNVDLRKLFGSYSPIDEENTYQVYFKTSEDVDKQIDEINEYKRQW